MRLINFSLWGDKDLYNRGAIANAREAAECYPGWLCRFYVHVKSPVIGELISSGCQVMAMPGDPYFHGALWRYFAAGEPDVEYCIFRDCDSRVNTREAVAVEEWIRSGKKAHTMKDTEAHRAPALLAGLTGLRGGLFPDMTKMIRDWLSKHRPTAKEADQMFLNEVIWPKIKDDILIHGHDSAFGKAVPFPKHVPMKYGEYVGQIIAP